ncbi:LPS translocon maturation chaperone LptM [Hydrogenophaga sp.]|uniref:LPS translocon maturation chaperone LptM n=1 Tax=Hydrogenophaga sp. TaxID=1904254 RepID=UPI003F6AA8EC
MLDLHRILGATARAGRPLVLAALLGAGLLLSGCGQKGPLFLSPSASASPQATDVPSSTANTDPTNATTTGR